MKSKWLSSLLLTSFFAIQVTAQSDLSWLNEDFHISYEGEINTNATTSTEGEDRANLAGSYVSLNTEWKNKIRAVLTAKLEHIFKKNKIDFNDDFDLAEFIKEAYIEIREVGGSPTAIIVGKQPVAFGQNVQAMPIFNANPLAELQGQEEVFGFTVDLTEGLFGIFDQIELSIFETEGGDLEIGKVDGLSVRLTKMLTDNILFTLSQAEMGNDHLDTGHERRTSVGLIVESNDGDLVGWIEGIYFSNNPKHPQAEFAITVGGIVRVHETTDIVVEYSHIENSLHQIAAGPRVALTSHLTFGVEVRYNNYVDNRDDEVVFGINLTYNFDSSKSPVNQHYIFGNQ